MQAAMRSGSTAAALLTGMHGGGIGETPVPYRRRDFPTRWKCPSSAHDQAAPSRNSGCLQIPTGQHARREQEVLLDAAIRVLGERGVRALTHRAVDAEASVGAGSTANYFPSREALFASIVERFAERERANFDAVAATVCPTTPTELGRALAAVARDGTGSNRTLTLAQYALLVESANNPGLREQMAATGARVSTWFANWLRLIGSSDPERDTHVVGNYLTGLVLHQLAIPDPRFDPTEKVIALLESLIGTRHTSTLAGRAAPGRRGAVDRHAGKEEPS